MNILQLCNKPPYPPFDGGSIGMNNVTMGLIETGNRLKLLSAETRKHPVKHSHLTAKYLQLVQPEYVFLDTRLKPLPALISLVSGTSYNMERFKSREMTEKLKTILKSTAFDIVLIESVFMAPYMEVVRQNSNAKVVVRAPNVEHIIWQRLAEECGNPLKKWYLKLLAERLKKAELYWYNKADGVYTVTEEDLALLRKSGCRIPMTCIPTGLDIEKTFDADAPILPRSVCHIGAMDWLPNQEGIRWFIQNVWNALAPKYPDAKLYVAGRNMPDSFHGFASESIVIAGEVPDAAAFIQNKSIMVVPLFSGSGMRVKIVEGMAAGKTVITTSVGIEGIPHQSGTDVLVADDAGAFADALRKCLDDESYCADIGRRARTNVAHHFDNKKFAEKNHHFFLEVLASKVK